MFSLCRRIRNLHRRHLLRAGNSYEIEYRLGELERDARARERERDSALLALLMRRRNLQRAIFKFPKDTLL